MRFIWSLGITFGIAMSSVSYTALGDNKSEKKASAQKESPIRLESVFVGDKEQPAISYFIPWQGIGTPDKLHWNMEQKHDNELDLVDREVMLRSIQLYNDLQLESP